MKIFICTDMEGCAGILNHDDWVTPSGRWYETGLKILTEETNAAVEGFFEGGASEVVVLDGHGFGGIHPLLLDERAKLLRGQMTPGTYFNLDKTYGGLAFVGQHAKAGTPYSHITHTGWFNVIDESINGISVGEFGVMALCAMELGIPTIFASGEKALAKEAEKLTPGVITVAVKEGILPDGLEHLSTTAYQKAKLGAIHLHHREACRRIKEGARQAIEKLKKEGKKAFKYPKLKPPYVRVTKFRENNNQPPWTSRVKSSSIIKLVTMPDIKEE